jgi:hypothetical protein
MDNAAELVDLDEHMLGIVKMRRDAADIEGIVEPVFDQPRTGKRTHPIVDGAVAATELEVLTPVALVKARRGRVSRVGETFQRLERARKHLLVPHDLQYGYVELRVRSDSKELPIRYGSPGDIRGLGLAAEGRQEFLNRGIG